MDEHSQRGPLFVALSIVLGVALAHRLGLFLLHRGDLDALIASNPDWYTFQHLPREMLRDHLVRALLLLQQTPPVSNLILGLVVKWFAWPAGVAKALIALQTLLSILTAAVLVHLLSMLYPRRLVLWTIVGLLFVIDTDLVVLEYNSMGQTIYGPLSMLGALVLLDGFVGLRRTGRLGWAAAIGVVTGLLVLTRATWYPFPPLCLLLVWGLAPARRMRAVLVCLVPILVLQGSWVVKNFAVYGVVSPATSSWGGLNALAGLQGAGLMEDFESFRVARGLVVPPPPDFRARDQQVERKLGLSNPMLNSFAFRRAFADLQRDFFRYALTQPGAMLRKCWTAYERFWQPIANYGQYYVALFAVSNRISNPFDLPGIARQMVAGTLPDAQYVVRDSYSFWPRPDRLTPTNLYTVSVLEPVGLMVEIVGMHLLMPLLGALWVFDRIRRGASALPLFDPLRMTALLVGGILYAYFAGLVNLVETRENMRYRAEIEPIVWIVTLVCVTELARLVRRRWRPRALAAGETLADRGAGLLGQGSTESRSVPCDLCGSAQQRAYLQEHRPGLVECLRCGLVFVSPRPASSDLYALYGKSYFESDDSRSVGYANYLDDEANIRKTFAGRLKRLERWVKPGRVLDVGCAAGFFLSEAKRRGWVVQGVDVSSFAVEYVRRSFGFDVREGSLADQNLPTGHYDLVTMWDVIEHVPHPTAYVREVHRLLRPGGVVVLATPDLGSVPARLAGSRWVGFKLAEEHIYYFSTQTLSRMLENAGFDILAARHIGKHVTLALFVDRLGLYTPRLAAALTRIGRIFRLTERSLYVNPFDIVAITARKR